MALSLRRSLAVAGLAAAAAAGPLAAQNAPSVSVGGVAYAQYAAQLDSGTNSNFDVTRAYVNVIGKFADGILTRVTGDIYQNADGSHAYRLKYAFINWTPGGSALTYRFGLMTTPWIDWEEQLWDYRMQGPVAVDRNHYMTSSDFGAGVDGDISNELVDFQASVVDGTGYGSRPGDMHKTVAGRVSVRLLGTDEGSRVGGLRLTGYAQYGPPTGGGSRNRFLGELSYRSKNILLAGEFGATTDSAPGAAVKKGTVFSAYGWYHVPQSPVGIVARIDKVDPNTCSPATPPTAACPASAAQDQTTELIGGVSYQLTPNVRLLADVDRLSFQNSAQAKITQALFQTQFTF